MPELEKESVLMLLLSFTSPGLAQFLLEWDGRIIQDFFQKHFRFINVAKISS